MRTSAAHRQAVSTWGRFSGRAGLVEQEAGVADDAAGVAGDVGAGGVADALAGAQAAELAEGLHHDHGRQHAAHADIVLGDGRQEVGRVEPLDRLEGDLVEPAVLAVGARSGSCRWR